MDACLTDRVVRSFRHWQPRRGIGTATITKLLERNRDRKRHRRKMPSHHPCRGIRSRAARVLRARWRRSRIIVLSWPVRFATERVHRLGFEGAADVFCRPARGGWFSVRAVSPRQWTMVRRCCAMESTPVRCPGSSCADRWRYDADSTRLLLDRLKKKFVASTNPAILPQSNLRPLNLHPTTPPRCAS